jgi:2-keto-4-pentenoate hydratase/2-oxohepta-3-ene-1,7-dioic acid hydratase in catechol pathway
VGAGAFSPTDITWHPPVRRPSKICCLALNNSANSDRILRGPKHPAMFTKPASALVGHGGAIECKPQYGRTHPEPELAVVIGKTAKSIRAADAYDYVFGYTIHNDITSPTMRGEDTFQYRAIHPKGDDPGQIEYVDTWVSYPGRYKCADTFACMGPWLVTKDEIPDPHALGVSCLHKERVVTQDTTANLTHKVPEVLAFLSDYLTLWPGDIVSMGTALAKSSGGGAIQNIDLNRLGGPVSVVIERIGTLSNNVVQVI